MLDEIKRFLVDAFSDLALYCFSGLLLFSARILFRSKRAGDDKLSGRLTEEPIELKEYSMEKQFPIGSEGNVEVGLKEGKVILSAKYDGTQTDAQLVISIDAGLLLDRLAAKVPGSLDDAIIAVVKAALKSV